MIEVRPLNIPYWRKNPFNVFQSKARNELKGVAIFTLETKKSTQLI